MIFLLDVNVLIALLDAGHVHHDRAHEWFAAEGYIAWATCPMTENGVLRILGNARYPGSPGSPAAVAPLLKTLCELPGHVFWPDTFSLRDVTVVDSQRLLDSSQVTDSYLLGLAHVNAGRLASFDRRLVTGAVRGAKQSLHLIA